MNDQAAELRRMRAGAPGPRAASIALTPAFVVGSGKGGVGKSVLSALLAAALARQGRRVLLLDGAQNQGNQHILLGLRPALRLEALLAGDAEPEDLLVEAAAGLWLLPADSGAETVHALSPTDRARLHLRLSGLYERFEAVVVDAGPGIESAVRAAATRATRMVVVAVPEPASLSDAYAMIKLVHLQAPGLPVDVLVNRVADGQEGPAVHERLALAARRFLHRDLGYLGAVPESDDLRRAARAPGSLLSASPAPLDEIAERLFAAELGALAGEERA
jgi:flagellar biosynthesis protein FlhG